MRTNLLAATALVALSAFSAKAEQAYPATLAAQAILPAATFIAPPADAPQSLAHAAKYTTPDRHRSDALGSVPGKDGVRPTGLSMPFDGQAVQGFSGIKNMGDGSFWSLSDNGFGSKSNSVDAALMLHHLRFDWEKGVVNRFETIFLSDPDNNVWFPIVNEGTKERYLTGADFDVESIQPVSDGFWIGDELGPFLIKVDLIGKVTAIYDTLADGEPVKSPDHPALVMPANPTVKLPPSTSAARKASRAWRNRRTAAGSTPCWKARSTRKTDRRRWPMATRRSASSNLTSARRNGLGASGSIRSPTAASRSATST